MKNIHLSFNFHFRMASLVMLAVLSLIASSGAQISGASNGQPVIATGAATATSDGSYIDAFVFSKTGDMCARILSAWNSLATLSGTIDARGFTGAQTCLASPFPSNKHGVLLLGAADISTSVTWVVPSRVHIIGLGSGGASGTATGFSTILEAASSSVSPVMQMGPTTGAPSFGVQISGLTIDCKDLPGCSGLLNNNSEEASTVNDVIIFNAGAIGMQVTTNNPGSTGHGAVNSGPYRNISIQFKPGCVNCGPNTIPLQIDGTGNGNIVRGFDNLTISGNGVMNPTQPNIGILISGVSTSITDSHIEFCTTGIQVGALTGTTATSNVRLENISVGVTNGGWDVVLGHGGATPAPVSDVFIMGLNHGSLGTQTLLDNVTGNMAGGSFLGWYLLGDGVNPAVISSAAKVNSGANLKWVAPGDLQVVGNLSKGSGTFTIDDPLDPANKYLNHSFVESPDMMNVYNGTVTTDQRGLATVVLPNYFDQLNREFRYQLTVLGKFAQATVAEKVHRNRFVIRTSKPGVEVSWQVTGIRQDPFANAHRVAVEEEKPPTRRGHYLHPEASGGRGPVQQDDHN